MWEKESGLVGMMEESWWDLAIPYLTKLFGCQSMVRSLRTATQHSMDGFNTASCGSLLATGPHPVVVCQLDHNETRTTSADLSKVPLFLISRFLCMKFHALGFMEHSFVWVLCQICCSNYVQSRVLAADFCNVKEYLNGPVNPLYKNDANFQLCLRGLWYPSLSLCSTSHSWCTGITGNQSITGFDQLWSTTENLEQTFMKGRYSFRALGYKTLGCLYVCIHAKRAIGQKQSNLRASSLRLRANNRMALQNPAWKLIWGLKLRELLMRLPGFVFLILDAWGCRMYVC
jgi:hypothetical protein